MFSLKHNRRNLFILFFTMIVVMLGFGMIIPIMPFYVKSFGASGSALGALMATFGLLQFLFAPLWGSLSDRYGRKPILMIGILGNAIAQLLFNLESQTLFGERLVARRLEHQGVVDLGHGVARELDIHHRADALNDLSDTHFELRKFIRQK